MRSPPSSRTLMPMVRWLPIVWIGALQSAVAANVAGVDTPATAAAVAALTAAAPVAAPTAASSPQDLPLALRLSPSQYRQSIVLRDAQSQQSTPFSFPIICLAQ